MGLSAHQRRMAQRQGYWPGPDPTPVRGAPSPTRRERFLGVLRHPLFLLLISSILISGVGRLYNDYSERVRDRADRREKLAPLVIEMRYRTLLLTRETNDLIEAGINFTRHLADPADQEELANASNPFSNERPSPRIAKVMNDLEKEFVAMQPKMLAVLRGDTGTSDPQFAKVHTAVLAYRIELLSGLPIQRFEALPNGARPELPKREVGVQSALIALEQNYQFDPSAFNRAMRVLTTYIEVREQNYANELLPVEKGILPPDTTDYLKRVDRLGV